MLEMLVTLALMSMVSTLLWQAMGQVMRVERLLQRSGLEGQLDTVRREWVRGLIEASLVEQTGLPRRFTGDAQQFSLASAEAQNLPGLRGRHLQIRLESDASGEMHRLMLSDMPAPAGSDLAPRLKEGRPIELLFWRGRVGGIRYLDARGQWLDHWPPPPDFIAPSGASDDELLRAVRAAVPRLPRAVLLELGSEAGGPLISAIAVTESGRLRLAQWEQM